jgi:KUP system potassium uptake protein
MNGATGSGAAQVSAHDRGNWPGFATILAVLGVVYGDIGTSPIYALRECFGGRVHLSVTEANVLGVLSLVFWALVVIISFKYMVIVLRVDNRGEGGIFALLAILRPDEGLERLPRRMLILLGIFGAGLLYGDAMITPAISVLSAVEGLEVMKPVLKAYVIPVTAGILFALFLFQRRGTAGVGAVFGPVMLLWFATLAALGIGGILRAPRVLTAVNPLYAFHFFQEHAWYGFFTLAAVFLVVTGGEALYADLGHFGRRPIRLAWFGFVLPSLLLNYFGQGALLLDSPGALVQPFYNLAPRWALYPLVGLATSATVIASQAVISGAFSLTRQAVQLGLVPRLDILQTSATVEGQIYIPAVNWVLLSAALALVVGFETSGNLAAAYGLSVNGTMLITTILVFNVAREGGSWSLMRATLFLLALLAVDLAFLGANSIKIPEGGWFPLVFGGLFFVVMTTWAEGGRLLTADLYSARPSLGTFIGKLEHQEEGPVRVKGTGVFLTGKTDVVPPALTHYMRLTHALHEQVVLLTVIVEHVPKVSQEERFNLLSYEQGFFRIVLRYGFMQGVNVPSELAAFKELCNREGLRYELGEITYFIGRKTPIAGRKERRMALWRDRLFAFMMRNTQSPTVQYRIPSDQVIEIGLQIGI